MHACIDEVTGFIEESAITIRNTAKTVQTRIQRIAQLTERELCNLYSTRDMNLHLYAHLFSPIFLCEQ